MRGAQVHTLLRPPRRLLLACAAALLLLGLGSCGAQQSLISVKGSPTSITRPLLDHWMEVTVGSDFNTYAHARAPLGLVSEPADYPRCARAAKKIISRSGSARPPSEAQIAAKCRSLHEAIKIETLAFLLNAQWTLLEGKEEGVKLSNAELQREFQLLRKNFYKTPANEREYLADHHMTVADAIYQLKRLIFYTRLKPKFRAAVAKAGGAQSTYVRMATDRYDSFIARTSCKRGYVVLGCKGYREPARPVTPAWVTLEALAAGKG